MEKNLRTSKHDQELQNSQINDHSMVPKWHNLTVKLLRYIYMYKQVHSQLRKLISVFYGEKIDKLIYHENRTHTPLSHAVGANLNKTNQQEHICDTVGIALSPLRQMRYYSPFNVSGLSIHRLYINTTE